jgi:predicted flap endonuclease-1-like 5' DNA nuclease
MRRFVIGLVLILGSWLLWRQIAQRRTIRRTEYAPRSPLPAWSAAPMPTPDPSVVKGTAERTHNQTDSLTQPQKPADPVQESVGPAVDTTLHTEEAKEIGIGDDGEVETTQPDDLIKIEGIGPKVSTIVAAAGITTFAELEATGVDRLRAILEEAGIHTIDPTTWPQQSRLAAQGKWDELQELQDRIKNGQLES